MEASEHIYHISYEGKYKDIMKAYNNSDIIWPSDLISKIPNEMDIKEGNFIGVVKYVNEENSMVNIIFLDTVLGRIYRNIMMDSSSFPNKKLVLITNKNHLFISIRRK